ncbi:hypothetical protein A2230_09460 [candidate division WOR-1 bacterium RIFOXYA2_FULL_36_21]|uniref:PPM-type phosphatase domain-containing protein n=1 Tax=candidate division WOR-1 bacterium RIFOXYB2_FULL_36_35 TaxID=1802578 RepID=A0A1F4S3S4_UNCSA|nr:MAG: hypothetical protein A2230_09460 [candidate division WOR-1 bacterium RIFOXYA2_FULL_36_21]OGC15082.1 MAG: hypothetical protein A2290_09280 [candidate division WOR-1 bacterium RIFOXYB2_FULL_36_35]OGC16463.1 MAG: hypothetical protein A2282_03385 [candidate division WOR-1 bacterium RIFOXYA12_FULL_36_13]
MTLSIKNKFVVIQRQERRKSPIIRRESPLGTFLLFSDIGRRDINKDAAGYIHREIKGNHFAAGLILDGVSSVEKSELTSFKAIEFFKETMYALTLNQLQQFNNQLMFELISCVQRKLVDENIPGVTTFSAILVSQSGILYARIGDSPIIAINRTGKEEERLSLGLDHVLYWENREDAAVWYSPEEIQQERFELRGDEDPESKALISLLGYPFSNQNIRVILSFIPFLDTKNPKRSASLLYTDGIVLREQEIADTLEKGASDHVITRIRGGQDFLRKLNLLDDSTALLFMGPLLDFKEVNRQTEELIIPAVA